MLTVSVRLMDQAGQNEAFPCLGSSQFGHMLDSVNTSLMHHLSIHYFFASAVSFAPTLLNTVATFGYR